MPIYTIGVVWESSDGTLYVSTATQDVFDTSGPYGQWPFEVHNDRKIVAVCTTLESALAVVSLFTFQKDDVP